MRMVIISLVIISLLSGCATKSPVTSKITAKKTASGATEFTVDKSQSEMPNEPKGSAIGAQMISPIVNY
jgi:uncharacterized protein YceK